MSRNNSKRGYGCLVFAKSKDPHLCQVKGCSREHVKGRSVCYQHHILSWRINNPIKAAYATLRDHAKRRRVPFTITLEEFTELTVPSGYIENKGNTKEDLHLDRINPLRGYVPGNLQVVTCSENSAKGAGPDKKAREAATPEGEDFDYEYFDALFADDNVPF